MSENIEHVKFLAKLKGKKKGGLLKFPYFRDLGEGESVAYGYIYNDNRFPDGSPIRTSLIEEVHDELKIIVTRNTYYEFEGECSPQNKRELLSQFYA